MSLVPEEDEVVIHEVENAEERLCSSCKNFNSVEFSCAILDNHYQGNIFEQLKFLSPETPESQMLSGLAGICEYYEKPKPEDVTKKIVSEEMNQLRQEVSEIKTCLISTTKSLVDRLEVLENTVNKRGLFKW